MTSSSLPPQGKMVPDGMPELPCGLLLQRNFMRCYDPASLPVGQWAPAPATATEGDPAHHRQASVAQQSRSCTWKCQQGGGAIQMPHNTVAPRNRSAQREADCGQRSSHAVGGAHIDRAPHTNLVRMSVEPLVQATT